ncbi:hypothetical protein [Vibrio sonorensis]|uniref:hypothetical protein n=1 Tax=Vibrio sonorensis TaxID=1004316 RepID=UPI0008D9AC90|nr:hypothetical protein [Vibrio sonorensis]
MTQPNPYLSTIYAFASKSPAEVVNELNHLDCGNQPSIKVVELIQRELKKLPHLAGDVVMGIKSPEGDLDIDLVLLYRGLVFVIKVEVDATEYNESSIHEVYAQARQLKSTHAASKEKFIVPVLLATRAQPHPCPIDISEDLVVNTIADNGQHLADLLEHFSNQFKADEIKAPDWLLWA